MFKNSLLTLSSAILSSLLRVAVISLTVGACVYNVMSSANIDAQTVLTACGRSLEKTEKSKGSCSFLSMIGQIEQNRNTFVFSVIIHDQAHRRQTLNLTALLPQHSFNLFISASHL